MRYSSISTRYGVPISTLTRRVHKLKIKPVWINGMVEFSDEQVRQILEYDPQGWLEKYRKTNHPRKIEIIEYYLEGISTRKISKSLTIHRDIVQKTIKEYKQLGYIVVTSKMNEI